MQFNMTTVNPPKDTDILEEEEAEEKPRSEKELLTAHITIKLRPSEKRILEKQAEETGLKLSPLVRSYLKKHDYL
jgi:hypothetical protein